MNFQFLLEKLYASEEWENFIKEFSDAHPTSAFFSLDKLGKEGDKYNIDFFVPSVKKLFSFQLNDGVHLVPMEILDSSQDFKKIGANYEIDFDEVEKMILSRMGEENITNKIERLLLVVSHFEGKDFIFGTVFISGLGLLKVNIDISENKITDFKKMSFWDIMKPIGKKDKMSDVFGVGKEGK